MERRRIKYYSPSDLATSYNIHLAESLLKRIDFSSGLKNLNDVLELCSILKYIDVGLIGDWEAGIENDIKKMIKSFLSSIKTKSLSTLYLSVEKEYYSEFWEFITQYNIYKNFSNEEFYAFLNVERPHINFILQHKKIVKQFDTCLGVYFKNDPSNATIILDIYEADTFVNTEHLYLPTSITENDKEELLKDYIESDNPNVNYLELITTIINRKGLRISDKTKLLASKRFDKERNLLFENSHKFTTGISIEYSRYTCVESLVTHENGVTHLVYSYNWIKDNLDFNTLLNNFIYLFEYADEQMRITLTSKNSEAGITEKIFSIKGRNNYNANMFFHHKEYIADIQLHTYINLLKSFNINIENVLSWFFTDYLPEYFQVDNYSVTFPSSGTTYFEKCRTIVPELEGLLKKFNLLVENGYIDKDLLEISTNALSFSSCKSFFKKKYVYPKSKEFNQVCYLLFSDQCMLSYIENDKVTYRGFFDLIRKRTVRRSDYHDYVQNKIDWLLEKQILAENNNELVLKDISFIRIIYELYYYETINYVNIPTILQRKVDELIAADYLYSEGTLFSQSEQDYLNYYLNRSKYGNSLDLRNRYVHGTQPQLDKSSNVYYNHYLTFIKILIICIIKINDELCNKFKLTPVST